MIGLDRLRQIIKDEGTDALGTTGGYERKKEGKASSGQSMIALFLSLKFDSTECLWELNMQTFFSKIIS